MEKWEYLEQFRQISLQLGESFWESEVSQVEEFGRYLVRLQKQICEKGNMQKRKNVKGKLPLKWVEIVTVTVLHYGNVMGLEGLDYFSVCNTPNTQHLYL